MRLDTSIGFVLLKDLLLLCNAHIVSTVISYPLLLFLWFFAKLCNPFKSGLYTTRAFVAKVLYQIALAPFGRCTFVDFFVADMLTSMAKVFTFYFFLQKTVEANLYLKKYAGI